MCLQAFNLTSNATDSLDSMLTKSLKSRLPATSFQLFGVSQIEEDNMATCECSALVLMGCFFVSFHLLSKRGAQKIWPELFCASDQRNEELPTLLHFAAKYDLKKLTTVLQECPGALQAYSVMNKHGDYPNKLAEKSGYSNLRQLMDKFVVSQVKSTLFSFLNCKCWILVQSITLFFLSFPGHGCYDHAEGWGWGANQHGWNGRRVWNDVRSLSRHRNDLRGHIRVNVCHWPRMRGGPM